MCTLIDDEGECQQRQSKLDLVELAMTNTVANNAPSQLSGQFAYLHNTKYYFNLICLSFVSRQ